jgi:hypothetical protein
MSFYILRLVSLYPDAITLARACTEDVGHDIHLIDWEE